MAERTSGKKFIKIRGANVNNLKNLSVDIPRIRICGTDRCQWFR